MAKHFNLAVKHLVKLLFLALALPLGAQVAVVPITNPKVQFLCSNGVPCAGGFLKTFSAGTSTPLATYADLGVTINPTTITLDANGRSPSGVYLQVGKSYKFELDDSTGAVQWTQDNVNGGNILQLNPPGAGLQTITGSLTISGTLTATGAVLSTPTILNAGGMSIHPTVFTNSGTYTIPSGVTAVKVTVVGGGGAGGGGTNAANYGAGGGAGGVAIRYLSNLTPGNTLTVTIGAAGAAGAGAGGNGGNSTVTSGTQTISTITGGGGTGGSSANSIMAGGAGGTASGGDVTFGGNAGGTSFDSTGGEGAASIFGGKPGAAGGAGMGAGAPGAGGGGSGTSGTNNGGNGAAGIVIFEWVG